MSFLIFEENFIFFLSVRELFYLQFRKEIH